VTNCHGLDGRHHGRAFATLAFCPTATRLMRNGPHKPTRRPLSKPAQGDENRAGIRALDCGEELETSRVIRRTASPAEPPVPDPPPPLGEQRQAL